MNTNTVLNKNELRALLVDVLDVDENLITEEAHFVKDLGVDSLMALEVTVSLERRYGVKIDESEIRQISCLRNAYEFLLGKLL